MVEIMSRIEVARGESHAPVDLAPPEQLLEAALRLARTDSPAPRRGYARTKQRTLTRRGVMWLGQTCNLRCHFCYCLDRIENPNHIEHAFMTLEKAKEICRTLREEYGNSAIDIQGGEPTLFSGIYELVAYCKEIGLYPTLITNALVLAKKEKCVRFQEAGIRDFLVSVQGLGAQHDMAVGLEGAHEKQMIALRNLQEVGIPFRFNCVMSRSAIPQLPAIATLAIELGANGINFLTFNPFEDQLAAGVRTDRNVPRYSEVSASLNEALDRLDAAGVECNVRYFPMCLVDARHRKSIYNFKQLPYDHHEWDYASWTWTGMQTQRSRPGPPSPTVPLEFRLTTGGWKSITGPIKRLLERDERIAALAKRAYGLVSRATAGNPSREELYWNNGELRAVEHCDYRYPPACTTCDLRSICDGFHGDYAAMFGAGEARAVRDAGQISHPAHYIRQQEKLVEDEDAEWVFASPAEPAVRAP
jgi:MoaA/NifB/PqqE/SkfB family radical SAM enzyme